MKRFIAVVLAVTMLLAGTIEGFAASPSNFTFMDVSEIPYLTECFSQFDQGGGNYVIPLDTKAVSSFSYEFDYFSEQLSNCFNNSSYIPYFSFTPTQSALKPGFSLVFLPRSNLKGCFYQNTNNTYSYVFTYDNYSLSRLYTIFTFVYDSERGLYILNSFTSPQLGNVIISFPGWNSLEHPLYFPDDSLFSFLYPRNNTQFPSLIFLDDISNISFMDYQDYVPPVNEHTLTVNYLYSNGAAAADPVTQVLEPGAEYSISSPEVAGYTPSIPLVAGTMPEEDFTVDVIYTKIPVLTINYLYPNGAAAADPVTQALEPGAEYSISSPEVAGYTPSIPLVAGTMPEEDLTVNVVYSMAFHTLTVQYKYADGTQAQEDVVLQYPAGFSYDVPTPEIAGYTPDKLSVAGSMPESDLTVTVTYSGKLYTLTVHYLYDNGSQAAESYQAQFLMGSSYYIPSPEIEGYHANQTAISGVMASGDATHTVTYRKNAVGPPDGGGDDGGDGGEGKPDSGWNEYTGYDPFVIPDLPPYTGYDPFKISKLPSYSYDPFLMPDDWGK